MKFITATIAVIAIAAQAVQGESFRGAAADNVEESNVLRQLKGMGDNGARCGTRRSKNACGNESRCSWCTCSDFTCPKNGPKSGGKCITDGESC